MSRRPDGRDRARDYDDRGRDRGRGSSNDSRRDERGHRERDRGRGRGNDGKRERDGRDRERERGKDAPRDAKRPRKEEAGASAPEAAPSAAPAAAEDSPEAAKLAALREKRLAKLKADQEAAAAEPAPPPAKPDDDADDDVDDSYFEEAEEEPATGAEGGPAADAASGGDGPRDALEAYMDNISSRLDVTEPARRETSATTCVVLENLITPEGAKDPQEAHEVRMETGHECSKWGQLLRVHVATSGAAGEEPSGGLGRVFVEFETVESAEECARAMDGRFFDGRRVNAFYYPPKAFLNGYLDEPGAPLAQQAITWDDIASMNSRPASSWDTMAGPADDAEMSEAGEPPQHFDTPAATTPGGAEEEEGGEGGAGGSGSGAGGGDEPSDFHAEFVRRLREQTAEVARRQRRDSQQLMDQGDDAMDALVQVIRIMRDIAEIPPRCRRDAAGMPPGCRRYGPHDAYMCTLVQAR